MRYDPVRRRAATLKRYGLTPPDYARLLLAQDGKCFMCLRPPSGRRMLDVDHDHITGEVRGLLCHRCNRALGYLNVQAAMSVMSYLMRPEYTGYFVPKRKRAKR